MRKRRVSISLLLTLALGFTACGGGGTPKAVVSGDPVIADTTNPVFVNDVNITTEQTIEEGVASLVIATIEATDDNGVTFSVGGVDADFFELDATKTRTIYSTVLKFKNAPDYEAQSVYHVSVNATDSKGNVATKEFTVTLTDKPFVFDVTGNMGSVVHNGTKTLNLSTKEAKRAINYSITGSSFFSINGNSVVFSAPDINATIGADNSYSALIIASDGVSEDINLTVSATVVLDPNIPAVKTYLLKSKEVLDSMSIYYDYEYVYDADNYLVKVDKKRNDKVESSVSYEYSSDHLIMRGKIGEDIDSIRVFENKKTTKNKFAANINNNRLSVYEYENYMSEIYDTLSYKNNRHMTKYIRGLSTFQTLAELYVYNDDDRLRRVLTGNYTIDNEAILALSDTELKSSTLSAFPSADDRLTDTQLNTLNSGVMPFQVNGETTYIYTNSKLIGIKGIDYLRDAEGNLTNVETHSFDAGVEYYSTNVLHTIESEVNKKVIVNYDVNSELSSVVNDGVEYTYSFYKDGKKMTITAVHKATNTAVATYNFEEE